MTHNKHRSHDDEDEHVIFDVGGHVYKTRLQTLRSAPSSYFKRDNWTELEGADGVVFIDRNGEFFSYVLDYLRDGPQVILPSDENQLKRIRNEADYFGLSSFVKQLDKMLMAPGGVRAPPALDDYRPARGGTSPGDVPDGHVYVAYQKAGGWEKEHAGRSRMTTERVAISVLRSAPLSSRFYRGILSSLADADSHDTEQRAIFIKSHSKDGPCVGDVLEFLRCGHCDVVDAFEPNLDTRLGAMLAESKYQGIPSMTCHVRQLIRWMHQMETLDAIAQK